MAFEVISSNQTATYAIQDTDEVVLLKDTNIVVTAGHAISGDAGGDSILDGVELYVHGDIIAQDDGIDFFQNVSTANNIDIVLSAQATLTAGGDGIILGSGVNNRIINYGQIITDEASVYLSGGEIDFQNYGSITSSDASFQNAVLFTTGSDGTNIRQFSNAGIISGFTSFFTSGSVVSNFGGAEFIGSNSGTIAAGGGIALYSDAGVNNFSNSGVIDGSVVFFNTTNLINTGLIDGDVGLNFGADIFDGRGGTVEGDVSGGDGDDTYIIDDATISLVENIDDGTDTVKSTVSFRLGDNFENLTLLTHKNINGVGNNGANSLIGNAGNNRLQGQAGNDVLNGAHGDDKLLGSFGYDTLQGGKGDDILKGGVDNDYLHLGNGDDIGIGGAGNDTILGVRGDDILKGGTGQDTMTGGLGDDVFLFTRKGHSTNAAADSITDFTSGADVIDLSAFNGTFDFIGNAAFSGTAKEVRFISVGADRTVKIDINGDGSTDMTILVNSATALVELDFVL